MCVTLRLLLLRLSVCQSQLWNVIFSLLFFSLRIFFLFFIRISNFKGVQYLALLLAFVFLNILNNFSFYDFKIFLIFALFTLTVYIQNWNLKFFDYSLTCSLSFDPIKLFVLIHVCYKRALSHSHDEVTS